MSNSSTLKLATENAVAMGLLMYTSQNDLIPAPFSLYPSNYPSAAFQQAYALAPSFNQLLTTVIADTEFFNAVITQIASADEFTAKLYECYQQTTSEQQLNLALVRTDYMLQAQNELRQIEINTISSAFACLATKTTELHNYLGITLNNAALNLPKNSAKTGFVNSLALAWQYYADSEALILFIVQAHERNNVDQYLLQQQLFSEHGIRVLRCSLENFANVVKFDSGTSNLHARSNNKKIAVVYFRAAYTPADYPTANAWEARTIIEQSNAIKCPNLAWQLVGTKKMQQCLAASDIVEKFMPEPNQAQAIRACFAGLYALDVEIIANVRLNPEQFVLKPQREGGGNNLYGNQMLQALDVMPRAEYNAWILMERIYAPDSQNVLVRHQDATAEAIEVVSELGVYASCFNNGSEIIENKAVGHLLRTKPVYAEEGGIVAGLAVLDSPNLI